MPNVTVTLATEEGDLLGVKPNGKMVVTEVQAGTICDGKIQVGDKIMTVNEKKVKNPPDFYRMVAHAFPECRLVVQREESNAKEPVKDGGSSKSAKDANAAESEQPKQSSAGESAVKDEPEQSKQSSAAAEEQPSSERGLAVEMVEQRPGFSYALVELVWKPNGKKLGLGIKSDKHRVYVSRIEKDSLAEGSLKVGDHLIDVNGAPVSDMDVAKKMIIQSLMTTKKVSFMVEHPETVTAKAEADASVRAVSAKPEEPSMQMPSDVREIMNQERQRMSKPPVQPTKGILRKEPQQGDKEQPRKKKVEVVQSDPAVINIRSDIDPRKNLRKIPKPP